MAAPRKPAGSDDESDESAREMTPTPDEDGPHDVPDEKVIEKTLPAQPLRDNGSGGRTPRGS